MKSLTEKPEAEPMAASERRSGGGGRYSGNQGNQGRRPRRERFDPEEYQIVEDETEEVPTAMEIAMRRALGNDAISAVKTEQRGGRKSKKAQREDQRRVQEDLLKRTLTLQSDN